MSSFNTVNYFEVVEDKSELEWDCDDMSKLKDNVLIEHYKTGEVKQVIVEGKEQSFKSLFDKSGRVIKTEILVDEKLSGVTCVYYRDGSLLRTTLFKDDARHGKSNAYSDNGKVIESHLYFEGRRINSGDK